MKTTDTLLNHQESSLKERGAHRAPDSKDQTKSSLIPSYVVLRRPGGPCEEPKPDPIPNSAVKLLSANGTVSQDPGESVAARPANHIEKTSQSQTSYKLTRLHRGVEQPPCRASAKTAITQPGCHANDAEKITAGWSSPVARQAHNLKVVGSNPAPATKSYEINPHHPSLAHPAGLFAFGTGAPNQGPPLAGRLELRKRRPAIHRPGACAAS